MELVDYVRLRWRVLVALLLVGVVVIVYLGAASGTNGYTASARLVVRPGDGPGVYASNVDRYIDADLAEIYTGPSLAGFVKDSGATVAELARGLSVDHRDGSDIVTISVTNSNPDLAVTLANNVANGYLADAAERAQEPSLQKAARIKAQLRTAQAELIEATTSISRQIEAFARANPDRGLPGAAAFPDDYSKQQLAQQRLQSLNEQLLDLQLQDVAGDSSVLRAASSAVAPQGWGVPSYLAALAGLMLIMLALAGAGLAVSQRIMGVPRWETATREMALLHAIRLRSLRDRDVERTARRAEVALRIAGDAEGAVRVVYVPGQTPRLERRTESLLDLMHDAGLDLVRVDDLSQSVAPVAATSSHARRTLLLVDVERADLDDALALGDLTAVQQRMTLPVLV